MKNGIFVNRQNLIRRGDHISQGDISVRVVVKFPPARFKINSDVAECSQRIFCVLMFEF